MDDLGSLLDGLPYVEDQFGTVASKAQAEALIDKELSRSGPFLLMHPSLPLPQVLTLSPMAQAEFERIERGEPQSARPKPTYDLKFDDDADPSSELHVVETASILAEMLEFQALNATISRDCAGNAFDKYAATMSNQLAELKNQLQDALSEQNMVNAKRKKTQIDAAGVLGGLEAKFQERARRCQQLYSVISHEQQLLRSIQSS